MTNGSSQYSFLPKSSNTSNMASYLLYPLESLDSSQCSTFSVNSTRRKSEPSNDRSSSTSVKFNLPTNSFHEVPSREDISEEDVAQIWYTHHDIKVIKSRLQTTIRMMKSGRFNCDGESYSFRGIQTDFDRTQRRERIAMLQMALSMCPSAHEFYSTPGLSLTLQELSHKATEEAILRATQDRDEALKVYRSIE